MLRFSHANIKTKQLSAVFGLDKKNKVYSFDLPSGYTCPGAKNCKSRAIVNPLTGRATIQDGKDCQFRCFSASQEVLLPNVRKSRQENLSTLRGKSTTQIIKLILTAIPKNAKIIRLHVSGDFFSLGYMSAWLIVASRRPDLKIYCYTKSLHFLQSIVHKQSNPNLSIGRLTDNFRITASRGGKFDHLIEVLNLREAKVVYSEDEANNLGLPIDHTDSHAAQLGGSFALMIHNVQPKNSEAAKAWDKIKRSKKLVG